MVRACTGPAVSPIWSIGTPSVTPERLIAQLIPPPTFSDVSFDTYKPDPAEPSHAAAVQACRQFCEQAVERRAGKKKLFGRREVLPGVGIYLDGGFGVGKTHLLASSFFDVPEPKAFATFGELTQLAGVFGFVECIELWPITSWCASTSSSWTTLQHDVDLATAVRTGRARCVGGGDVEHTSRAAR